MGNNFVQVIGGFLKGKKLLMPPLNISRPTISRIKEDCFNILQNSLGLNFKDMNALDAFCGSGSLGIEFLSRKGKYAVFVDCNKDAINVLRKNLNSCNLTNNLEVIEDRLENINKLFFNDKFDIVFLDPPFDKYNIFLFLEILAKNKMVDNNTIFYYETSGKKDFFKESNDIEIIKSKAYKNVQIIFFKISSITNNCL
jgi:16S rRNA (guanine966-N2)-methyltransferase